MTSKFKVIGLTTIYFNYLTPYFYLQRNISVLLGRVSEFLVLELS